MQPVVFQSPTPAGPDPVDVEAYAYGTVLRTLVELGASTAPRSQQRAIGASEIGHPCQRRHAYRHAGTPPVNQPDPTRSMVGTAVHLVMADIFRRLDAGTGRYLVETPVSYRGVPGTVDLYDRATGTLVDWKTTLGAKVKRLMVDGPPAQYVTQVQLYGAALAAAGESVRHVALAYLPVDTTIRDLWVWRAPADPTLADDAVNRADVFVQQELTGNPAWTDPATVEPRPSRLCPWCPYYQPTTSNLTTACPGNTSRKDT